MQLDANGGFPAIPEGEAWGLLLEVGLLSPFFIWLSIPLYILTPVFLFPFIFQGLVLLKRASSLWKEAYRIEVEAQHLETEGLGKMEVVVAGSEAEGFYGLLRGEVSHPSTSSASPPHKKVHHTPSTTIPHLPPQKSTGPEVSDSAGWAMESASPAVLPASEEVIPAHMQPLHIQLGGIKWVYRCQVEGCREGPSTSHFTICAHVCKVHLGVGLVCSSCSESFFNPDTF